MTPDQIEIGKTYRMSNGALDRKVLDINWYPAEKRGFIREYREVVVEIVGGKSHGKRTKESLLWFANSAVREAC